MTVVKNKTDKKRIARLALDNNLSARQIAAITGAGKTRIAEIIQEVKQNPDVILFADNKDKVFEGLQRKLINLADDDLLKTMLSKRGMTDVAILEDKIRNIRGLATEVHDVQIRALIAQIQPTAQDNAPAELSTSSENELSSDND